MKLAKYVKFREEKFGGVLFETRSEKVFTLNPTAAAVVRAIEQGGGEGDIVDQLTDDFHDHDGIVASEAAAFIAQLKEQGLVVE
jgi:hypothetical protein